MAAFHVHRSTPLGGVLLLAFGLNNVQAQGFSVPEISVAGTALSNALVANHKIHGAVAYNPSLAAYHTGTQITGGINIVQAESHVTPAFGTPNDFQGQDNVFIPNLMITHRANSRISAGLSISVPFGLSTDYPLGTFGTLAAFDPPGPALGPGALQTTKSKVEIIDVAPTLTFNLGENSAVAIGIDYYWAREVIFDAQEVKNSGDGNGWGWNVSASHVVGDWSFGASFHSRSEVDIDGTSVIGVAGPTPATATLVVPWRAQVGARYQVNERLAVEADISRIGWNSFDTLTINNAISPVVSTNNWEDANGYRLGATYDVTNQTQLRFGYTRDETGSGDDHFSARTADSNRHLFSFGVSRKLGRDLELEASYMLVKLDDRTHDAAAGSFIAGLPNTDPNGTDTYNGTYETTVHLFGIGVSKRF